MVETTEHGVQPKVDLTGNGGTPFNPFSKSGLIIIDSGGTVSSVDIKATHSVPLSDFLSGIRNSKGYETPILPPGILHVKTSATHLNYVLAYPPAKRLITVTDKSENKADWPKMEIFVPYQIWVFRYSSHSSIAPGSISVFFAEENPYFIAHGLAKKVALYHPGLNNIHPNGNTCFILQPRPGQTRNSFVVDYINGFWTDEFNAHLEESRVANCAVPEGADLERAAYYEKYSTLSGEGKLTFKQITFLDVVLNELQV